jgi:2,5-diamino-6-(ribosylamino)-4(3H)-pyrimidinone 5'-phosphate reductase
MQRPYVIVDVAASVDGKIDTFERRGAAISSRADRERVDRLRASVDAVMVGGHTLHDEDPRLTIKSAALRAERVARGLPDNPVKIGIASRLNLAPDCRFLSGGRKVLFVPRGRAVAVSGAEVFECGEGRVDVVSAMAKLRDLDLNRVLVEGGGSLNFELLRLGLVDEVQVFVAPMIFGGASAPTLADGEGIVRESALMLRRVEVQVWDDGGVLLRYMVDQT